MINRQYYCVEAFVSNMIQVDYIINAKNQCELIVSIESDEDRE